VVDVKVCEGSVGRVFALHLLARNYDDSRGLQAWEYTVAHLDKLCAIRQSVASRGWLKGQLQTERPHEYDRWGSSPFTDR